MKKTVLLIGFLVCAGSTSLALAEPLNVYSRNGETHHFEVRVADDTRTREKGLMGVKRLPDGQGMLFVFDDVSPAQFWMKNTLIPLDMVFIDGKGVVSSVHHEAQPLDLSIISSEEPVRAVLEVSGGVAERLGIGRGDQIISSALGKPLDKL